MNQTKKQQNTRWRAEHPDYNANWQKANADKARASTARYLETPKGKEINRAKKQRRQAIQLNQFIEDVNPKIVYQMHGGMCGICEQFVPEDDFHVDHVIPLSKGGMHGYVNVQPAHPKCNVRKGSRIAYKGAPSAE